MDLNSTSLIRDIELSNILLSDSSESTNIIIDYFDKLFNKLIIKIWNDNYYFIKDDYTYIEFNLNDLNKIIYHMDIRNVMYIDNKISIDGFENLIKYFISKKIIYDNYGNLIDYDKISVLERMIYQTDLTNTELILKNINDIYEYEYKCV